MSCYSIHHAALRIDYLIAAYAGVVKGAPYDPEGVPAQMLCDIWHDAAADGLAHESIITAAWMRYVSDFQLVEDVVRAQDRRLAEKIGTVITGIDWERMSEVMNRQGAQAEAYPVGALPAAHHPHARRARMAVWRAAWRTQCGMDYRPGARSTMIRLIADVIHWCSWIDLDHEALVAASVERYRAELLGSRDDHLRMALHEADPTGWGAIERRQPITPAQWIALADAHQRHLEGDVIVTDLVGALFP